MIIRSESILALLPPAIAVTWVIVEATTGLVSADREIHLIPPVVQIVDQVETASTVNTERSAATLVFCSTENALAAGIAEAQSHGLSQATVKRLCRAGLKFTSSLPKT
jgi:hypothetical protein